MSAPAASADWYCGGRASGFSFLILICTISNSPTLSARRDACASGILEPRAPVELPVSKHQTCYDARHENCDAHITHCYIRTHFQSAYCMDRSSLKNTQDMKRCIQNYQRPKNHKSGAQVNCFHD